MQIIFEQKELIEKATETIIHESKKLGEMPIEASNIIRFLNYNSKYELQELGISDRTTTIFDIKKVLTKRNLID